MKDRHYPEFRHIRYFVAAADHGSFRKAGIALDVQESAISRRIRDLEDLLGASLFHRQPSGVSLTLAGQRFLHRARLALQSLCDGARDVAAIGRSEEGRIKIGIFSTLASGFLHELLNTFERDHPAVEIELIDGNPAEHIVSVRQLRLDLSFIASTSTPSDCDTVHLWNERMFLALPKEHDLTKRDAIDWPDIASELFIVSATTPGPEVHEYLMQHFAEYGRRPEIHPQHVGRNNLMTLVAIGRGLTIISEATTAAQYPGVVYRPIRGEVMPFSAVWSPHNDNPACRRLLSMARQMAAPRQAVDLSQAIGSLAKPASPSQSPDLLP